MVRRFLVIAVSAVLWIGLLPTGASAAVTRWVDDDGRAGPTSCRGTRAAPRSIQAAIDASGRNDTIRVCNGTYVGNLTIKGTFHDGLLLRAVNHLGAEIVPAPPTRTRSRRILSIEQTSDVTIRGFDFRPPTSGRCREQQEVIFIRLSQAIHIEHNRIVPRGSSTLGRCGYVAGVRVGQSTASVEDNRIIDFKRWGIRAEDGEYEIARNSLVFRHDDHTGREIGATGIAADSGGLTVIDNTVAGVSTRSLRPSGTPLMGVGIQVDDRGGTLISGNDVRFVGLGLTIRSGAPIVEQNTISDTAYTGLSVSKSDNGGTVSSNRVRNASAEGIYIRGTATGIQVTYNRASGNRGVDCRDDTAAGGGTAGTGNTWTGNVGDESSPAGLCTP